MEKEKWSNIENDLKKISKEVLSKSTNVFDIERFNRILDISTEMENCKDKGEFQKKENLFNKNIEKLTPKLDSRAAIFKEDKILLVQESNKMWTMPGGWIDYNMSLKENLIKESKEEAGVKVEPVKLVAVQDRKIHNEPEYIYNIYKIFVICKFISGNFIENIETLNSKFFKIDEIPQLSEDRTNLEQIKLCFKAYKENSFIAEFD